MSNEQVWYFQEQPDMPALNDIKNLKHSLKTAWAGLKTLARYQVQIVYPNPWDICATQREAWMDYYLESLSLLQEYPDRVVLWPLDVWLAEHGIKDVGALTADSLAAFLLNDERPELFELLEALEAVACLQAKGQKTSRQPVRAPRSKQISAAQMSEIRALLKSAAELESANVRIAELAEELDVMKLAGMREKAALEKSHHEINALKEKALELSEKKKEIDLRNKELMAKNSEISQERKSLASENRILTDQMFKVQEALEVAYSEKKLVREEIRSATAAMQTACKKILSSASTAVGGALTA